MILKTERKQKSTSSSIGSVNKAQPGTTVQQYKSNPFAFWVLVDESQLPAIGVVSQNGQSRYLVRTLGFFPFFDLADGLLFIPKLFVQACVKISECKKISTSAYTLMSRGLIWVHNYK